jgi:hypothetical protein
MSQRKFTSSSGRCIESEKTVVSLAKEIGAILERKDSITAQLSATVKGLASSFESNQKTPEELIYELFKLPNKEVASIGRLLAVRLKFG